MFRIAVRWPLSISGNLLEVNQNPFFNIIKIVNLRFALARKARRTLTIPLSARVALPGALQSSKISSRVLEAFMPNLSSLHLRENPCIP